MKLLLFDIDGTLVTGGPAKEAFESAMIDVFGTAGPINDHDFSGKTDPQIARELLERAGLGPPEIEPGLPILWRRYLIALEAGLYDKPMRQLPGVGRVLDALRMRVDVRLGLLTGNIEAGAVLKLRSVGLDGRFRVGGFGSDREVRNHLPAVAVSRAHEAWGIRFEPEAVVVVGDTPRDVECGRTHGARTVAVATGRWAAGELAATGPDYVLSDLADLHEALAALVG